MPEEGKEVAPKEAGGAIAIDSLLNRVQRIIEMNLETVDRPQFPRTKILHAGSLRFKMPTGIDGAEEELKEIEGIIIHIQRVRGYWSRGLSDGGGKRPDCSSMDGKTGIEHNENLKITCAQCDKSKFGSAEKGRGQACKEMRRVFMRLGNDFVPTMLTVPPTSLQVINDFLVKLLSAGYEYTEVKVKLSLEDTVNRENIHYSRLKIAAITEELEDGKKRPVTLAAEEKAWVQVMRGEAPGQKPEASYMRFMQEEPLDIQDFASDRDGVDNEDEVPY